MLLQLRVTAPPDRTGEVRELFERDAGTAHLAVLPGASLVPRGDLVLADVARESADGLVAALRGIGIDRGGGIVMVAVDAAVSRSADQAERAAPGESADAVVWEQVVRTTEDQATPAVSWLAFLTIAVLLAAVAIVNDSAVVLIGAMVLGPEFGAVAGLAVAAVLRRGSLARKAAVSLGLGFPFAIAITTLAALVGRELGWIDASTLAGERPETDFLVTPDRWTVLVAVLAGIAGVLSLTSARSGPLVGVFISVTTVPAAGDMALALALGAGEDFVEGATQLGVNLTGLLLAAVATLLLQSLLWRRVVPAGPRVGGA